MKILSLSFLMIMLVAGRHAHAQVTTVILLRHAEKGNDGTKDPDLTPEGYQRAQRLVSVLHDTPIDAVYSTNYKRTKNTVQALADSRGLKVQSYEPLKREPITSILEEYKGKTIVISGHSNTIPWTANLLTGKDQVKDFPDDDYDNILIVSLVEMGEGVSVTWLNVD